jgi:hypothetical protein
VALQAALGSDPVRETLSALRLNLGGPDGYCSALFETPLEAVKVIEWRAKNVRLHTDSNIPF